MVAWPVTVVIAASAHVQTFTPSGFVANSATVLNPNDGILYVARDRDCLSTTVGAWDWKVPSQSYAGLPGPFRSVGLYYVDRSGGALPAEVTVYLTDIKLAIPTFNAIGRAQITNVSNLDIGMGPPPQPPAAGNARLWADATGDMHVTLPGGQTFKLIDDNDPLGGALQGTLLNPRLVVYNVAGNSGAFNAGGAWANQCSLALAAGTYLLFAECIMQPNGGAGNVFIRIVDQTATELDRAWVYMQNVTVHIHIFSVTFATPPGSYAYYLQAVSDGTQSVVPAYGRLMAIKIG